MNTYKLKSRSTSRKNVGLSNIVHFGKFNNNINSSIPALLSEPACSPLDFDTFLPWQCKLWGVTASVLVQKSQENLDGKVKQNKNIKTKLIEPADESKSFDVFNNPAGIPHQVPVTTYYNTKNQLVEIAIVGSQIAVCKEIICIISLCVPYHSSLTRFTYRKTRLTASLIYEINKLLPISNISEVVFDDSNVTDANYYILLEQPSQLKYLSLNRCKINDEVCKKIFENLIFNAPAANNLQLLDLGSNDITDNAAIFIGSVLRTNRCLLHLNLSGNKITDNGFLPILDSLMEFQLNSEEKYAASRRKIKYLQSKEAIYEKCLANLKLKKNDDLNNTTGRKKSAPKPKVSVKTIEEQADIMTKGILGNIQDPFSSDRVVVKNDATYSKGNATLCYINIAYNYLEYPSVQRLHNVLQYQDEMRGQSGAEIKGLIKVTLDGNRIPATCPLLDEIIFYLKNVIYLRTSYKACSKTSSKKLCIPNLSTISKFTHLSLN